MGLVEMGKHLTQDWFSPLLCVWMRGDPQVMPSFSCGCWGDMGKGCLRRGPG